MDMAAKYMIQMNDLSTKTKKYIKVWLGFTLAMLFLMVMIGGITRLTDSGLSMVEWKPLLGAIPPLNEQEWLSVFKKYQQFPEYQIVNHRMNLEEFKFIFFWEYFHRLFGRLIGLVFIVPYLFFFFRKKLNKKWNRRLLLALVLGGSQGLLGWFMVMSGLVDRPDVSHLRLAAHFSLALGIIGYISFLIFELSNKKPGANPFKEPIAGLAKAKKVLLAFTPLLSLQIVYGAFVAGLDAGIGYNTFPKMGKYWVPKLISNSENILSMLVHSNAGVQLVHRCLAWLVFIFACYFVYFAFSKVAKGYMRWNFLAVGALVWVQFTLGVATLLSKVQLSLASAHQMVACVLAVVTIKCFYDVIQVKN